MPCLSAICREISNLYVFGIGVERNYKEISGKKIRVLITGGWPGLVKNIKLYRTFYGSIPL